MESGPPLLKPPPPLACLSCPYPSATLAPLHPACLRQASCHVLLVKSCSGHFCNSCGKEHANGEGGVATVLLFPQTSLNPSCSVNHMEVYGDGAVNGTTKLSFWVLDPYTDVRLTYCYHPVWSAAFFVLRAPRLRL